MPPKLPVLSARDLIRVLNKLNFIHVRSKGSHYQFKKGNLTVTIPIHKGDVKRETLKSILRQAKLSVEELKKLI